METETQGAGTRVRGWLLAVLGVALVALVAYQMWPEQSATPALGASNRQAANRRTGAARTGGGARGDRPGRAEGQARGAAGEGTGFRQGRAQPVPLSAAAGAAAAAAKPVPPTEPIGPPPPPPPPPIPPIPLKFMGTVEKPGLTLAALTDCKGFSYAAREGEIIDGRYRLVKIQVESVILEYSNGTGRTTVRKSGDCPK